MKQRLPPRETALKKKGFRRPQRFPARGTAGDQLHPCLQEPRLGQGYDHGIDMLVGWSEGVNARLQADGWREVDARERSLKIPRRIRDDNRTIGIGEALQGGSPSRHARRR